MGHKQVSRAGTSNYIRQILWDVIACPWPWYLLNLLFVESYAWYISSVMGMFWLVFLSVMTTLIFSLIHPDQYTTLMNMSKSVTEWNKIWNNHNKTKRYIIIHIFDSIHYINLHCFTPSLYGWKILIKWCQYHNKVSFSERRHRTWVMVMVCLQALKGHCLGGTDFLW